VTSSYWPGETTLQQYRQQQHKQMVLSWYVYAAATVDAVVRLEHSLRQLLAG
jgi:hypothetical protein